MRFLLAPDSFKGSLTATRFCEVAAPLLEERGHAVDSCPLADGGEGTARVWCEAAGGTLIESDSLDPLGHPLKATWALLDRGATAVIDLAEASGLARLSEAEADPLKTSTEGTGLLLRAALDAGCSRIVVGLGGSATVDGGTGALSALGFRFLDARGRPLPPGGGALVDLDRIDASAVDPRVDRVIWQLACDVRHTLLGRRGAAVTFAPQKGAGPEGVGRLEKGLTRLANRADRPELVDAVGAGAAGGAGFGLAALLGADLCNGFDLVAQAVGFGPRLSLCDWVVTGEGAVDETSLQGKVVGRVLQMAASADRPALLVPGQCRLQPSDLPGRPSLQCLASTADEVGLAKAQAAERLARVLRDWLDSEECERGA